MAAPTKGSYVVTRAIIGKSDNICFVCTFSLPWYTCFNLHYILGPCLWNKAMMAWKTNQLGTHEP